MPHKPSCVYPGICPNLNTDHSHLIKLYRRARALPGIKKIFIASGLRYDLAVESPEYVKELVTHHVGGYLKIAPRAYRTRAAIKNDEAGHGDLRPALTHESIAHQKNYRTQSAFPG